MALNDRQIRLFLIKKIEAINKLQKILFSNNKKSKTITEDHLILSIRLVLLMQENNVHPIRIAAAISTLNIIFPEWRKALPISLLGKISKRDDKEVSEWRKTCLKRDKNKCVECESIKDISVHHIFSWSEYPELRLEIDNGETLCGKCHHKKHPDLSERLFVSKIK